jgi:hypothetical protein
MITDPKVLREIHHRDELPDFLNRHGLTGYAAEVGTYLGEFGETILSKWTGKRLNLIDPYRHFSPGEYVDGSAVDQATGKPIDFEEVFWKAHARLNPYPHSYFIRQTSAEAVTMFQDGELDFVNVDANHSYEHVDEDIRLWWPKLIQGGVMGLHDCYTRDDGQLRCGVFDAVMDFAENIGQRPHLTRCTTAWFLKP